MTQLWCHIIIVSPGCTDIEMSYWWRCQYWHRHTHTGDNEDGSDLSLTHSWVIVSVCRRWCDSTNWRTDGWMQAQCPCQGIDTTTTESPITKVHIQRPYYRSILHRPSSIDSWLNERVHVSRADVAWRGLSETEINDKEGTVVAMKGISRVNKSSKLTYWGIIRNNNGHFCLISHIWHGLAWHCTHTHTHWQ